MIAKFLMNYPGYTWRQLITPFELPWHVFKELFCLIDPVHADKAIEINIRQKAVEMSGKLDLLENLRGKHIEIIIRPTTKADMAEGWRHFMAIRKAKAERLERIRKGKK